jgi:uncharacterized membrane protein YqiK
MNIDVFSILPIVIVGFVLLIVLIVILRRIFVNVGPREIAIKERRYLGRMPQDAWWPLKAKSESRRRAQARPALSNPFTERLFAGRCR